MKKLFLFFSLITIGYYSWAQIGAPSAGARSFAMGEASTTLRDVYSAGNNPAAMPFVENPSLGLSGVSYFGFSDLTNAWLATVLPTDLGAFGGSVQYQGDPNFNQTKVGIGYGRKLSNNLSLGILLDYCHTRINELGTGSAITFDAGLLFQPIPELTASARVFNPIKASPGNDFANEQLPALFALGLAYEPSKHFLLLAEAEQDLYADMNFKFGLEIPILEQLFIRGGYITKSSSFSVGFGVVLDQLRIDAAGQFQPQLGFSPAVGLQYLFIN